MLETLKTALSDVIETVPYNSFGKAVLAGGGTYPRAFGGNCVFQGHELQQRLVKAGIPEENLQFTTARERPHWVVLAKDGNHLWYLDPFSLCPEPIDLARIKGKNIVSTHARYPTLPTGTGQIKVSSITKGIRLRLLSPTVDGGLKPVMKYTYRLDTEDLHSKLPDDGYQVLASIRQKHLIFTSLHPDRTVTMIHIDPVSETRTFLNIGEGQKGKWQADTMAVQEMLTRIAEEQGQTYATFDKFINEGLVAYHSFQNQDAK